MWITIFSPVKATAAETDLPPFPWTNPHTASLSLKSPRSLCSSNSLMAAGSVPNLPSVNPLRSTLFRMSTVRDGLETDAPLKSKIVSSHKDDESELGVEDDKLELDVDDDELDAELMLELLRDDDDNDDNELRDDELVDKDETLELSGASQRSIPPINMFVVVGK
jgi:hypothetical protein